MNRIILIGNGFDLAHGLKTGYKDFIDSYWLDFTYKVYSGYAQWIGKHYGEINLKSYEDDFASLKVYDGKETIPDRVVPFCEPQNPYSELCSFINGLNNSVNIRISAELKFKNNFFEHISNQCSLVNWVDIENEYYKALKKLLLVEDAQTRSISVKKLNKEFDTVKNLLETYLAKVTEHEETKKHQSIQDAFSSLIEINEIAQRSRITFLDSIYGEMEQFDDAMDMNADIDSDPSYSIYSKEEAIRHCISTRLEKNGSFKKNYCTPSQTLILNFNYTNTAERLYTKEGYYEIINIHGELNNKNNPIIFGYGDELDDAYKTIEELQDNDFLENIKSINYHKTRNYRRLLDFIHSGLYQVFVMGHSCGNSDRTLLNTLFEHDNCASVKVFYHQTEDGKDDYSNLIRNISRNFNDKARMRDTVVNWEDCSPLVPVTNQEVLT